MTYHVTRTVAGPRQVSALAALACAWLAALAQTPAGEPADPVVETERSIRFILFNNEETGLHGASAYVAQRKDLQGIESPKGSGKYSEPKWLGMIQHDMVLFDHGMPVRVPAISVRENERGTQIGAGWSPHWHQPTDLYSSYSDKDFLLGLNAAQTTLAAVAQLTGTKFKN